MCAWMEKTLEEAHRTATAIENTLKEQFGKGTHVGIHVRAGEMMRANSRGGMVKVTGYRGK